MTYRSDVDALAARKQALETEIAGMPRIEQLHTICSERTEAVYNAADKLCTAHHESSVSHAVASED